MKIEHGEYLQRKLDSLKMELENLNIEHRINIAKYETKKEMIQKDIDGLERQLAD